MWQSVQDELISRLHASGLPVDEKVKDPTRSLRLVGSINKKNRERVWGKTLSSDRISFSHMLRCTGQQIQNWEVELERLRVQFEAGLRTSQQLKCKKGLSLDLARDTLEMASNGHPVRTAPTVEIESARRAVGLEEDIQRDVIYLAGRFRKSSRQAVDTLITSNGNETIGKLYQFALNRLPEEKLIPATVAGAENEADSSSAKGSIYQWWRLVASDLEKIGNACVQIKESYRDMFLHFYSCALCWTHVDSGIIVAKIQKMANDHTQGFTESDVRSAMACSLKRLKRSQAGEEIDFGKFLDIDPRYRWSG
jgi:hypothetical protein